MLFVRDNGQMGNNILHYGHAYAWARENGRKTISLRFAYKYRYFRICQSRWHNILVYLAVKFMAKTHCIPVLDFPNYVPFADIDKAMRNCGNAVVEGWGLRFYELFLKYRSEITEMFAFLPKVEAAAEATLRKAESGGERPLRIGVHVRRGDYKQHLGGKYYYEDDVYIRLIRSAIDHARSTGGHDTRQEVAVYVCGNDPSLDKAAYTNALPEAKVHFPKGNPGEDLCLLSKMDYLLGPPSTFSLVAAMYRDLPIYFIREATAPLAFHRFADYFVYDDCRRRQPFDTPRRAIAHTIPSNNTHRTE